MNHAAKRRRLGGDFVPAVGVAALLAVALALAGCGLGPGEDTGDASLIVTRDYGSEVLIDKPDIPVNESSNAMRLLDESAELETRYGGEFVQSVNGISGGRDSGRSSDWFFAVNGIVAERGSAQFTITGGDKLWWDYRDWTDAMEIGAVVGSYPAPFSTGYDDRGWGVEVDCMGDATACVMVRKQLEGDGANLEEKGENLRLMVGTWEQISGTPEGQKLEKGPGVSGVFAKFRPGPTAATYPGSSSWHLVGLDARGETTRSFDPAAGLVAAMRKADEPPVWLITGGTEKGVQLAAAALNPEDLERRFAAVVSDGQVSSLPLP
ncbi:MAG: DUF4430 domain-containing protein [Solirubrobacterales bacterium]|nr:DUF4430 domain-containing protein [Solirubrobacterales bacterium]HRV59860.1 DUF4430 domain-containing protein [Solirubrobacterales bacterium]